MAFTNKEATSVNYINSKELRLEREGISVNWEIRTISRKEEKIKVMQNEPDLEMCEGVRRNLELVNSALD